MWDAKGNVMSMNKEFSIRNRIRSESPTGFNHPMHAWSLSDWFITVFGEPEAIYQKFSSKEICCELELLLRYLDKIQYEKKRWFLSAIEVIDESKRGVLNLIKT